MRLAHTVVRNILLAIVCLALAASCALAGHVAPVLPLTSGSNHSHEKFTGTAFPAADLTNIDLSFADLSNCTFAPGTNLTGADFTGAKLVNANLSGCILDFASFRGADLTFSALPCAGNTDFRGAILTGATAPGSCSQCVFDPNVKDQCTVGDLPGLCMQSGSFRGVIAGVVFTDLNSNGVLDHGEPGVAGVNVQVTDGIGLNVLVTDSRGAYGMLSTLAGPASSVLGPLPVGMIPTGGTNLNFNLVSCRSGQNQNFATTTLATPTLHSSFGQLKLLYR